MFKILINTIKVILIRIRLYNVNIYNLKPIFFIGRYSILQTQNNGRVYLNKNIVIHDYVKIISQNYGVIKLGENINIGDYSTIRASYANIEISSDTMLGQNVTLISTNHAYQSKTQLIRNQGIIDDKKGIRIGYDCWLGAGVIVLPGVTIGNGVVVGAGSVVTKDIPDFAVVVGSPAKIISYRN